MSSRSNWFYLMFTKGDHFQGARKCTACKPFCILYDALAENRFTRMRAINRRLFVQNKFVERRKAEAADRRIMKRLEGRVVL